MPAVQAATPQKMPDTRIKLPERSTAGPDRADNPRSTRMCACGVHWRSESGSCSAANSCACWIPSILDGKVAVTGSLRRDSVSLGALPAFGRLRRKEGGTIQTREPCHLSTSSVSYLARQWSELGVHTLVAHLFVVLAESVMWATFSRCAPSESA